MRPVTEEVTMATIRWTPEDMAESLFNVLLATVGRANNEIRKRKLCKPKLYITKQTDILGQYRIDIDYPVERQDTQTLLLANITVILEDGSIILTMPQRYEPATFKMSNWWIVLRDISETIRHYYIT